MLEPTGHGEFLTVQCPLCGGRRGDDYIQYARHLESEHTADDLALGGDGR